MNERLTVGSLFSGIGGFDLGLERAGMRTVWFAEQDPFCQRVLARHWPGVPCYPDVRALVADASVNGRGPGWTGRPDPDGAGQLEPALQAGVPVSVPHVDVLAGGFPCQDLSLAGKGAGIDGARSGLWSEFARLIRELRPRYVIVENVPALLGRGAGRVLGDLAACGFDAEWDCLPASAFGAPHRRDRFWLVAYPAASRLEGLGAVPGRAQVTESRNGGALADAPRGAGGPFGPAIPGEGDRPVPREAGGRGARGSGGGGRPAGGSHWLSEPAVGRVAHGIPDRVDRLRALGNSLVPQIAEWIGRRIVEWERGRVAA